MKLVFRQGKSCVLPETALAMLVPVSKLIPKKRERGLKLEARILRLYSVSVLPLYYKGIWLQFTEDCSICLIEFQKMFQRRPICSE